MTSSILVLGAGELGMAVLTSLASHTLSSPTHPKISVLLRQATLDSAAPAKQLTVQRLKELNIGFETADVAACATSDLAAIFSRYETIVSCNGMGLPSGTQLKLSEAVLLAAAERVKDESTSKTKRYFPWQFGMDYDIIGDGSSQDLFDEQLKVRKRLREQRDLEWTIVSTGLFMSFLFEPAFGVVDIPQKTVRALGSWDNTITVTTPEDIGKATADVILDPRGEMANQVVYTAGDTASYQRIADDVEKRFGGKWTKECWDLAELKKQMETDGGTMVKYRDTFAQGRGVAWEQEKTVNYKRGIKMVDIKRYLEEMNESG